MVAGYMLKAGTKHVLDPGPQRLYWYDRLERTDSFHVVLSTESGAVRHVSWDFGSVPTELPWLPIDNGRSDVWMVLLDAIPGDVIAAQFRIQTSAPKRIFWRFQSLTVVAAPEVSGEGVATKLGYEFAVLELRRTAGGWSVHALDQLIEVGVGDGVAVPLDLNIVPDRLVQTASAAFKNVTWAGMKSLAVVVDGSASMRPWHLNQAITAVLDCAIGIAAARSRYTLTVTVGAAPVTTVTSTKTLTPADLTHGLRQLVAQSGFATGQPAQLSEQVDRVIVPGGMVLVITDSDFTPVPSTLNRLRERGSLLLIAVLGSDFVRLPSQSQHVITRSLGAVTGATAPEDILARIAS
jgi:hypothetical protein